MAKLVLKYVGLLFLSVLVACALSACGSTAEAPAPGPAGPSPTVTVPYELPITLTFRGHFEPQELQVLDEEIAHFERKNSNVKVAVLEAAEAGEERQQEFSELLADGDTSTDLYALDTGWIADFEASRWLMPLDDYVPAQGGDLSALLSDPGRAHRVDGKLVALSSSCLPGKVMVISPYSPYAEQAFRFLAFLLRCGL